ncbi:MAG TPA: hypothetical protein VGF88_23695 [Acidobacteriaceae bacterium]
MSQLKLAGQPFDLARAVTQTVRLKTALDKTPADTIYRADELAKVSGVREKDIRQTSTFGHSLLSGYSAKVGATRFWGNPKAIKELLRQVGR